MTYDVRFEYKGAYAELELWDDGATATLAAINATFKMRGAATKVLLPALEYADFKGLTVVLQISPFGDDVGMDKTELRAWYMSKGFEWKGDGVMERKPLTKEVVMELRPWGDFTASTFTEKEAADIVDRYGTAKAHFYIQEGV